MAPTEKLAQKQHEMLPADFSGWDSSEIPATLPDDFSDFDTVPNVGSAQTRPTESDAARAISTRGQNPERNVNSSVSADSHTGARDVYGRRPEGGVSEENQKIDEKRKPWSKVMVITIGSTLLLLIVIPLIYLKVLARPVTKQKSVESQSQPALTEMKPSPATPEAMQSPQIAPEVQTPQTTSPAVATEPAPQAHVQSEMMSKQLNAPARLTQELKKANGDTPPSSSVFGATSMEGLNGGSGAINNVFSGHGGPKVKISPPQKVNISAGVATGLLVEKTAPIYPIMAKMARVSGTVVLAANISKIGKIENLRVVSGPAMLRQAATDAVKNWRYRPYLLNHEPVEVETTVYVNFTLGG